MYYYRFQVDTELIFIDEAGINLWMQRTRGRAPKGQRAVRVVTGQRGRNLTVIFAISNRRGLHKHNLQVGGMTGDLFVNFLEELSQENSDRRIAMVFDKTPAPS